jgi:hypothetical protein
MFIENNLSRQACRRQGGEISPDERKGTTGAVRQTPEKNPPRGFQVNDIIIN